MSTFDKILAAVVLLQALYALYQRFSGQKGRREAEEAIAEAEPVAPRDRAGWLADVRARFDAIGAQIRTLLERAERTDQLLAKVGGPGQLLRQVLASRIRPTLEAHQAHVDGVLQVVVERPIDEAIEHLEQRARLGVVLESLRQTQVALGLMEAQAKWRTAPRLREVMGDADAIAVALLAPLRDFTRHHGIRFPAGRPICAPGTRQESVWFDLLPGHPVLQVPDDFGEDLLRWSSVGHEVGHILYRRIPGLGAELSGLVPAAGPPWLPTVQNRRLVFDIDAAFGHWLEELACDAFSMMLLGPAALHGMVHVFQRPDRPQAVLEISSPDGRTVGTHPPEHLRILLCAWLLERMGFLQEPEALRRLWDRAHGAPAHLLVPTEHGEWVQMPLVRFRIYGQQLFERLYTESYQSLGGYPLSAVNGLEMSPGVWARVKKRAHQLLEGTPFNDDPRVVIAAGMEAAGHSPGAQVRIAKGVRRGIQGIGLEEAPVADAHYAQRRGRSRARNPGRLTTDDMRDAIVLGALFGGRRSTRQPRRPHPSRSRSDGEAGAAP